MGKIKAPRGIAHTTVTINGRRRKVRYCNLSIKRAKAHGLPLSKILDLAPQVEDESAEVEIDEMLEFTSAVIWLGLLAFEPDLTVDELDMELDLRDLRVAAEKVMPKFGEFMPEPVKSDDEEEQNEAGKMKPTLRIAK